MSADSMRAQPWYRERWPWILMAGPAIVVVAGIFTAWLAIRSDDGLVVDDYYKQGLAINQTLGRSDTAGRLGIGAELQLTDARIRVRLAGPPASGALSLRLVHPTRAGRDQGVKLAEVAPGIYEGQLEPLQPGRWHVVLEARTWRLAGDWTLPAERTLSLAAQAPSRAGTDKTEEHKP